jgi:hypothetical protein
MLFMFFYDSKEVQFPKGDPTSMASAEQKKMTQSK